MQISGFIVFLGATIASRIISEWGYRKLSSHEKLRLMDGFSASRAYSMIPLVLLIAAFWLLSTQTEFNRQLVATGYFTSLILYVIARVILNQRKLSQLEMPTTYRRTFSVAQTVSFLGVAWFFFAIFYN